MNLMAKPFEKFFKPRREPEISLSEEDGIRYLHFGSVWIQGAMRVRAPYELELEYTRELFAGMLFHPQPKNITLLGLGANWTTQVDLHKDTDGRVDYTANLQTFVALQYLVAKQLFVKAVAAYARSDFDLSFSGGVYSNTMLSGRLRLMYLF